MRQALGGAEALDAVRTLSARGSRTLTSPIGSRRLTLEWFASRPDHFLEIRHDSLSGPIQTDIVYYTGFAGSRVILRTDARGLPFPETKYADDSAQAVAARERRRLTHQKQSFARLTLALFGTATIDYPLQLGYAGVAQADGKSYDVIDATGADEFRCRLYVDAATHLPAMLTWTEELPIVMTSSSTTVVKTINGRVVGDPLPPSPPPSLPEPIGSRGTGPKRWIFSDFKAQDGVNWPRKIEEEFDGRTDEIRIGGYKINPKIDMRKFDIR